MVHGRFQPFHNGHLEYLLGAYERSSEVFVGITNPDPLRIRPEASDPLRHLPESNPWSYAEKKSTDSSLGRTRCLAAQPTEGSGVEQEQQATDGVEQHQREHRQLP